MKSIEIRYPLDLNESFAVFKEVGEFFPCPWHYHPEYELVLVLKSTGRRMVGDHIGFFKEEDLVFMGSSLPHVWVNDPKYMHGQADHLAEAIVIHFKESFLGDTFFEAPEMESIRNFLRLSSRGMAIKGKARGKIITIMKKMVEMKGLPRLVALMSIFDILGSPATEYDLLASPGFINHSQNEEADRLGKVMAYIMQNLDEDITLPKVASLANMGLTTFCNSFKKYYRITFVEYLNTIRVGYACKLLSEKDATIAEIAYSCGFNTLANFNRQFKKYKGYTPKAYRQQLHTGPDPALPKKILLSNQYDNSWMQKYQLTQA
jgi:AraC-like DNA-binding protein